MVRETLVFVPPILCNAQIFGPQINALSAEMPIMYAPTTQGERMEEIASQILSWTPAKFALCGMGMGGAVALEILRRAPDRVSRIALISTSPHADTPDMASAREPFIVAARSGRFNDVIAKEMNPEWLSDGPDRMAIANFVADMAMQQGAEAYVKQARAMQRRRDQQPTLRQIKQPALIMCGCDDTLMPIARHEFMAGLIPAARLEVINWAGHLPTLENPDAVTNHLRDWMAAPANPLMLR